MRHQNFLAPIAFALGLAAAGVASAQTLTMGVRGGPDSMDPHFSALGPHAEAAKHIFDTLVWSGTDLQIEPGLATSWKAVDEDTWEFKLRQGVKFHDGSDFDAEDVKFSIERIPVVSGPTTTTIYVRRVAGVDIIDTALSPFGEITSQPATESMSVPNAQMISFLAISISPVIYNVLGHCGSVNATG